MLPTRVKVGILLIDNRVPESPELLYKFLISGYEGIFGHLLETTAQAVEWDEHWEVDHARRTVKLLGADLAKRNRNLHETLTAEREREHLSC